MSRIEIECKNNQIKCIEEYSYDKKHGGQKHWYRSGQIKHIGEYHDGEKRGTHTYYDIANRVIREEIY